MIGYVLLAVAACIMLPFTVWHYAGYWNGRYDPEEASSLLPLTPCHDASKVTDPSNAPRKDHDS